MHDYILLIEHYTHHAQNIIIAYQGTSSTGGEKQLKLAYIPYQSKNDHYISRNPYQNQRTFEDILNYLEDEKMDTNKLYFVYQRHNFEYRDIKNELTDFRGVFNATGNNLVKLIKEIIRGKYLQQTDKLHNMPEVEKEVPFKIGDYRVTQVYKNEYFLEHLEYFCCSWIYPPKLRMEWVRNLPF